MCNLTLAEFDDLDPREIAQQNEIALEKIEMADKFDDSAYEDEMGRRESSFQTIEP